MKVIAIIPARGGSQGLKNKNKLELNGLPLISRPIRHALDSSYVDTVYVTTDDPDIQQIAQAEGATCPFLRPDHLSASLSTTEDTLKYALNEAENYFKYSFDICVFLTATDIYRQAEWIDECIVRLIETPSLESVFVGYKTTKNYWEKSENKWTRVKDWMKFYSSRQIRKSIVREDTGVCCASRSFLWREGRRIGDNVDILVKEHDLQGLDIHNKYDFYMASCALKYLDENP